MVVMKQKLNYYYYDVTFVSSIVRNVKAVDDFLIFTFNKKQITNWLVRCKKCTLTEIVLTF